jgi:hypothetical protein
MPKISAKMRAMQLKAQHPVALSRPVTTSLSNLFDAAKHGDADAARRMIEEQGADINAKVTKLLHVLYFAAACTHHFHVFRQIEWQS